MGTYLAAIAIIFALFSIWVAVQFLARAFARRHPEFGPVHDGPGCGGGCACAHRDSCESQSPKQPSQPN